MALDLDSLQRMVAAVALGGAIGVDRDLHGWAPGRLPGWRRRRC